MSLPPSLSTLRDRVRDDEAAYLATLRSLVEIESPSHDAAAGDRLAARLVELLETDGWQVERLPRTDVGDIVVARLDAGDPDDGSLILAHYDTVWPLGTLATMPWRREGDRVSGPGIVDMKAGIAAAFHAVRWARAEGGLRGPVTLLVTSDEEIGSDASRGVIEAEAQRHARVLVVEPGRDDGAIKIGRKGVAMLEVVVRGRSAHAGLDPASGASALRELAHLLLFAEDLGDAERGTTVNVTVARGGSTSNVIAEEAHAKIDLRVTRSDEGERVLAALRGYEPRDPRVEVEVLGEMNRPPMEPTDANRRLHAEAVERLAALGLSLDEATVGGASDGNFTSALGIATLDGLGSVGGGAHARDEHIRVPDTLDRVAFLAALLVARDGSDA